ncbi:uncharacterized protein LOC133836757, partial [Drosophila sulfurigaster albostrigata]|uniref:uncharacterized protein LOC133836757 n=1 Tax=Drosophila sulfurigaster albostrigata TaxID=89887 RepID=UPI002D21EA53
RHLLHSCECASSSASCVAYNISSNLLQVVSKTSQLKTKPKLTATASATITVDSTAAAAAATTTPGVTTEVVSEGHVAPYLSFLAVISGPEPLEATCTCSWQPVPPGPEVQLKLLYCLYGWAAHWMGNSWPLKYYKIDQTAGTKIQKLRHALKLYLSFGVYSLAKYTYSLTHIHSNVHTHSLTHTQTHLVCFYGSSFFGQQQQQQQQRMWHKQRCIISKRNCKGDNDNDNDTNSISNSYSNNNKKSDSDNDTDNIYHTKCTCQAFAMVASVTA